MLLCAIRLVNAIRSLASEPIHQDEQKAGGKFTGLPLSCSRGNLTRWRGLSYPIGLTAGRNEAASYEKWARVLDPLRNHSKALRTGRVSVPWYHSTLFSPALQETAECSVPKEERQSKPWWWQDFILVGVPSSFEAQESQVFRGLNPT